MKTMTTNSKEFNSNIFLANYGKDLSLEPLNFLWNNKVYLGIKEFVMDELDNKNSSYEAYVVTSI